MAAAKNPDPKMVAKFETLSAADAAFDKKIHSAKGLQTLSSSERERLTRENADMVFYGIEKGDFKVHQKLEELDPNLGMVPFDPNVRSRHGDTFLTAAVKAGSKPYVEEFLRKGTDPALKDGNGKTALELANELNRKDLAALLKGNK
ncbi:MAG: ankyrin repeat domain-containing protein [Bdellovibrionota bacterium]